jgi:hypothetical protein
MKNILLAISQPTPKHMHIFNDLHRSKRLIIWKSYNLDQMKYCLRSEISVGGLVQTLY